jgi:hypothetical protein
MNRALSPPIVIVIVAAVILLIPQPGQQPAVPMAEPAPKIEPLLLPPKDAKPAQVRQPEAAYTPAPLLPDGQKTSLWLPQDDDGPNAENKWAPGSHRGARTDPNVPAKRLQDGRAVEGFPDGAFRHDPVPRGAAPKLPTVPPLAAPKTEVQAPPQKEPFELPVLTTRVDPLPANPGPPWYLSEKVFYGVMGLFVGVILGVIGCFIYMVRQM